MPPTISMTFVIFHLLLLIFVSDTSWLRLSVLLVKMIVPTGTAATAPPTNSGMRPTVNFTGSSNHRPTSKIFCIFCNSVFEKMPTARTIGRARIHKKKSKEPGWAIYWRSERHYLQNRHFQTFLCQRRILPIRYFRAQTIKNSLYILCTPPNDNAQIHKVRLKNLVPRNPHQLEAKFWLTYDSYLLWSSGGARR